MFAAKQKCLSPLLGDLKKVAKYKDTSGNTISVDEYFCDIKAAWFSRHEACCRGVMRISDNEKTARIAKKTTKRLKNYENLQKFSYDAFSCRLAFSLANFTVE